MRPKTSPPKKGDSDVGQEEIQSALHDLAAEMQRMGIDPKDVGLQTLYEVEQCKFNDHDDPTPKKRAPLTRNGGATSIGHSYSTCRGNTNQGQLIQSQCSVTEESHHSSATENVGLDLDNVPQPPVEKNTTGWTNMRPDRTPSLQEATHQLESEKQTTDLTGLVLAHVGENTEPQQDKKKTGGLVTNAQINQETRPQSDGRLLPPHQINHHDHKETLIDVMPSQQLQAQNDVHVPQVISFHSHEAVKLNDDSRHSSSTVSTTKSDLKSKGKSFPIPVVPSLKKTPQKNGDNSTKSSCIVHDNDTIRSKEKKKKKKTKKQKKDKKRPKKEKKAKRHEEDGKRRTVPIDKDPREHDVMKRLASRGMINEQSNTTQESRSRSTHSTCSSDSSNNNSKSREERRSARKTSRDDCRRSKSKARSRSKSRPRKSKPIDRSTHSRSERTRSERSRSERSSSHRRHRSTSRGRSRKVEKQTSSRSFQSRDRKPKKKKSRRHDSDSCSDDSGSRRKKRSSSKSREKSKKERTESKSRERKKVNRRSRSKSRERSKRNKSSERKSRKKMTKNDKREHEFVIGFRPSKVDW
jgi:hypothetical protein